jgi:hypothetical protein
MSDSDFLIGHLVVLRVRTAPAAYPRWVLSDSLGGWFFAVAQDLLFCKELTCI